jgi:hypothetical protein
MTYFTRQFSADVVLPDGSVATSASDIDRYLRAHQLAAQSDYSADYFRKIRRDKDVARQSEIFAELVQQYQKRIWK